MHLKRFRPRKCYENYIKSSVGGFHHAVGSCKMGKHDDEMAVVDPALK